MCQTEVGERKIKGLEMMQYTIDKIQIIRNRLKAVQDRQKNYADLKRRDIKYNTGDRVVLKISPWKKNI